MKKVIGNERVRILSILSIYHLTTVNSKVSTIATRDYIIEYKGEKSIPISGYPGYKQQRKERFQKTFIVKHKKSGKKYKVIYEYGKVGQSLWYVFRYK